MDVECDNSSKQLSGAGFNKFYERNITTRIKTTYHKNTVIYVFKEHKPFAVQKNIANIMQIQVSW